MRSKAMIAMWLALFLLVMLVLTGCDTNSRDLETQQKAIEIAKNGDFTTAMETMLRVSDQEIRVAGLSAIGDVAVANGLPVNAYDAYWEMGQRLRDYSRVNQYMCTLIPGDYQIVKLGITFYEGTVVTKRANVSFEFSDTVPTLSFHGDGMFKTNFSTDALNLKEGSDIMALLDFSIDLTGLTQWSSEPYEGNDPGLTCTLSNANESITTKACYYHSMETLELSRHSYVMINRSFSNGMKMEGLVEYSYYLSLVPR